MRCRSKARHGPWCDDCGRDRKRQQSLIDVLAAVPDWHERLVGNERHSAKGGRPSTFQAYHDDAAGIIDREERERTIAASVRAVIPPIASGTGGARLPAGPVVPAIVPGSPPAVPQPPTASASPPYQTSLDKARAHLAKVAGRIRR